MIFPRRRGHRSARPTTGGSCRSGCSTAGCTNRTSGTPSADPATRTGRWPSSPWTRSCGPSATSSARRPAPLRCRASPSSSPDRSCGPIHVAVDGRAGVVDQLPGDRDGHGGARVPRSSPAWRAAGSSPAADAGRSAAHGRRGPGPAGGHQPAVHDLAGGQTRPPTSSGVSSQAAASAGPLGGDELFQSAPKRAWTAAAGPGRQGAEEGAGPEGHGRNHHLGPVAARWP